MDKVLITGGAGFIGTALIKKLLSKYENIEIVSVDNYSSGCIHNHVKSKSVKYFNKDTQTLIPKKFDLNNTKMDYADAFEPNVVFHFGEFSRIVTSFDALNNCWDYNMQGTKMVIDYCVAKKAKLVYTSCPRKFGNDNKDENLSPYDWTKAKMVELINNYGNWFDLKFELIYFNNIQTLDEQSRDVTNIKNIVSGVILAAENGLSEY